MDAYFHIPIHPSMRRYLRYAYRGKVWQFRALPFGLSTAPWIFTMVVKELQVFAHLHSICLHQYLDDWILYHRSPAVLRHQMRTLIELGQRMGFLFNWKKSDLRPSRDFLFVGYRFVTDLNLVLPSRDRVSKVVDLGHRFLRVPVQPASQLQSLLGLFSATEKLVPLGRLHMRELQHDLWSQWAQKSEPDSTLIISPCRPNPFGTSSGGWTQSICCRVPP